ncbi:MAG: class I SAM-dependent methyltransferase [Bryobacteraceae bacterium]|jgi:SAM-dependent methyltransferase
MRTRTFPFFLPRGGFCIAQALCSLILAAPLAAQAPEAPPVHVPYKNYVQPAEISSRQEPEPLRGDVPYVPTPVEVVEAMLKLGQVHAGDVLYDLGCGDGRIVVMAVQKFGVRTGTGIDIDPQRIKEALENARQAGVSDKTRFIEKNLFDADIHDATVVTLYLLPEVNLRLRPKLLADLKVGTRIVSHQFDMGEWQPDKKVEIGWRTIYLWTVTERAKKEYGGASAGK